MGRVWNVEIRPIKHLGAVGKFNINSSTSSFGIFKASGGGTFNDYTLTNPNTVDANGQVTTAGETQIWGFDTSVNDSFVKPIKEQLQVFDDPNLHRKRQQGIYGWMEFGYAVLDPRSESMGVIDRSL